MIFQCKLHESYIYHKQGFLADQSWEDQCIRQSGIIYMGILQAVGNFQLFAVLPRKGPPVRTVSGARAHTYHWCNSPHHFRPYSPRLHHTGKCWGYTGHFCIPPDPGCDMLGNAKITCILIIATSFSLQITSMIPIYLASPRMKCSKFLNVLHKWMNISFILFIPSIFGMESSLSGISLPLLNSTHQKIFLDHCMVKNSINDGSSYTTNIKATIY